jgi:hypothetical protein
MAAYMNVLTITIGWMIAIFVGILGILVLWRIFRGDIKLNSLLEDENNKASLSRFQFLIFTFVIALSLFLIIVAGDQPAFPETIPAEIFVLLGISGGSYLISKGVQVNRDTRVQQLQSEEDIRMQEIQMEQGLRMQEIQMEQEARLEKIRAAYGPGSAGGADVVADVVVDEE